MDLAESQFKKSKSLFRNYLKFLNFNSIISVQPELLIIPSKLAKCLEPLQAFHCILAYDYILSYVFIQSYHSY